jgi:hypothetical protein
MDQLILSDQATGFLRETKKWTYFLAIMGFIGAAFMLLAGIFMTIVFSLIDVFANVPDKPDFPFGLLGLLYVVLAVVYFFPAYYLYKFSKEMGDALLARDETKLTSSIRYLKKHFKFVGIMVIAMIALYVVLIIVMVIVGIVSMQHATGTGSFV